MVSVIENVELLAVRCEKAPGSDRKIDSDIAEALDLAPSWAGKRGEGLSHATWFCGRDQWDAPSFTASLDAAMTLVPEGYYLDNLAESEPRWWACLKPRDLQASRAAGRFDQYAAFDCSTPALALCAAALRARARPSPSAGD